MNIVQKWKKQCWCSFNWCSRTKCEWVIANYSAIIYVNTRLVTCSRQITNTHNTHSHTMTRLKWKCILMHARVWQRSLSQTLSAPIIRSNIRSHDFYCYSIVCWSGWTNASRCRNDSMRACWRRVERSKTLEVQLTFQSGTQSPSAPHITRIE